MTVKLSGRKIGECDNRSNAVVPRFASVAGSAHAGA
jgi:hypothetical protein